MDSLPALEVSSPAQCHTSVVTDTASPRQCGPGAHLSLLSPGKRDVSRRTQGGGDDGLCPQTLDVTEQLDAGVRYLDLRIAHMADGSEKNLHFVHMVYTSALVEVGKRYLDKVQEGLSLRACGHGTSAPVSLTSIAQGGLRGPQAPHWDFLVVTGLSRG